MDCKVDVERMLQRRRCRCPRVVPGRFAGGTGVTRVRPDWVCSTTSKLQFVVREERSNVQQSNASFVCIKIDERIEEVRSEGEA